MTTKSSSSPSIVMNRITEPLPASAIKMSNQASDSQPITYKEQPAELLTALIAAETARSCTQRITAKFAIDPLDDQNITAVGHLKAFLIDRTDAAWLEYMITPQKYEGELRQHANASDPVTETQKILKLLYTNSGGPKLEVEGLDANKIWYIEEFEIFPDFRGGKGFAQKAMDGFFRAASGYLETPTNTFFLSPAPLAAASAAKGMPIDDMSIKTWQAAVEKLCRSYERTGFEMWHKGRIDRRWTISIMGLEWKMPAGDKGKGKKGFSQKAQEFFREWEEDFFDNWEEREASAAAGPDEDTAADLEEAMEDFKAAKSVKRQRPYDLFRTFDEVGRKADRLRGRDLWRVMKDGKKVPLSRRERKLRLRRG